MAFTCVLSILIALIHSKKLPYMIYGDGSLAILGLSRITDTIPASSNCYIRRSILKLNLLTKTRDIPILFDNNVNPID